MARVVVIGAGIVGLAVAERFARRGDEVIVLEKESGTARHQTGRNSGVVHSGLYYAPGSLKARMCAAGSRSMVQFAHDHGVDVLHTGKLVVATAESQLHGLDRLLERGIANGVPVRRIGPDEAKEYEPHVRTIGALRVDSTAIIDYPGVCDALARLITAAGGTIRFGTAVRGASNTTNGIRVDVGDGDPIEADRLVACAGLHSDRIARRSGVDPQARIIPFRGEYFTISEPHASRVRGLVYPVPDPNLPFLGVHITRMISGELHTGPNAVLAMAREGYRWRDVNLGDTADTLLWPGFWRVAMRNAGTAANEVARSAFRSRFARDVATMLPGVTARDLVPAPAGVRAQAVLKNGTLLDDFLVQQGPRQVHVINAPSPAATCAFEIADHVVALSDLD